MKLTATYVWSAMVEVNVPNDATEDEQREALDSAAMDVELDFRNPVMIACSNQDLVGLY